MRIYDPLCSPRVLKAIIDDVIDQVTKQAWGYKATPELLHYLRDSVYAVLDSTRFRGSRLTKLISIEFAYAQGHGAAVALQVLITSNSEDGYDLLKEMNIIPVAPTYEVDVPRRPEEKPIMRRLIEL